MLKECNIKNIKLKKQSYKNSSQLKLTIQTRGLNKGTRINE
jgi:hypothetical protein